MIQAFFILLLLIFTAILIVNQVVHKRPFLSRRFLYELLAYHYLLATAYFVYILFSRSDSYTYYYVASTAESWSELYGTSTTFIKFLAFPLVQYLAFSFESCMVFFAFIGYLGFVFFYVFLKEQLRYPVKIWKWDGVKVLLLLPNAHFWSSSLGKGSVIFLGICLLFYAFNRPQTRWLSLLTGAFIVYHVRPHILLVILFAVVIGFVLSSSKVPGVYRFLIVSAAIVALVFIYEDVLKFTGLEEESMLDPLISHRAYELTKATSGIDITNYSFPEKIFAFLFRPLFFDAPGIMGIIVSLENLFYLLLFLQILRPAWWLQFLRADPVVKTAFLSFIAVSIALAQISGNLGLSIRQKSQVMLLGLFVLLKLQEQKQIQGYFMKIRSRRSAKQGRRFTVNAGQ